MEEEIPVWLDCDPGHDDAMAILLASYLPWFKLLGISTVHGNASLENTTTNAISILTAYEKFDINVFPGAEKPLVKALHIAQDIHGKSGLDGTALLPSPAFSPQPDHSAVSAMAEAIESYPGQLAIVATGTLSNIAQLVERRPDLLDKIAYLSIMGGGIELGNWTKYAEFNIWCDAKAAQIVLNNPVLMPKTILVPLDLTHQAIATEDILTAIQKGKAAVDPSQPRSIIRQMLYELLTFFADTYRHTFGFNDGPPVHDPLAVICLLPFYKKHFSNSDIPEIHFNYTRYELEIVQSGEEEGRTKPLSESHSGVMVGKTMDMEKFWSLVLQAVDNLDNHVSSNSAAV